MRVALVLLLSLFVVTGVAAQESGGSFGDNSWDDEPSGGGGSWSGGGGGGSSWGGGSGSSWDDHRAEEEARREDERRAEAEEARRRAEEERRRAEEERRRIEEERRIAEALRRARLLALPPLARAMQVGLPVAPVAPSLAAHRSVVVEPIPPRAMRWTPPEWPPSPAVTGTYRAPFSMGLAGCCSGAFMMFFLPVALLATRKPRQPGPPARARKVAPAPSGHARKVTLAFDWTARAALQAELKAMSQRLDMKGRPGLHAAAREVASLLTRHGPAARYATWELSSGDTRSWFQSRVNDLRSRFTTDRVRKVGGQSLAAAPHLVHEARPEEGAGLVVVSMLVASKSPMRLPAVIQRAEDVGTVLSAMSPASANEMLALEVIWSPSEENDRMSSLELERFYPELMPLGGGVGRYQCKFCRAPYPRELGKCPTCGGPASD